eukprot:COSAG06_NODE_15976_length_1031_cov_1.919528_1_plen_76_part_10
MVKFDASVVVVVDEAEAAVSAIVPGGELSVVEGGDAQAYSVTLDSQPVDDVQVSVFFAGGIVVEPTELIFTADTWA